MLYQDVINFLHAALECSIYVSPTDPGLTSSELSEAAKRAGFLEGEINDSIPQVATQFFGPGSRKLQFDKVRAIVLTTFGAREEPDYRNPTAFHGVFEAMRLLVREKGAANAQIERFSLIEKVISDHVSEHDAQVAVAVLVLNEVLSDNGGVITFSRGKEQYGSPGDSVNLQAIQMGPFRKEWRARAFPIVKKLIEERGDFKPPETVSRSDTVNMRSTPRRRLSSEAGKVFIGHGRSDAWMSLRDLLRDRLCLSVDEYNIVPTAGMSTVERLQEMLSGARFAFLIMTAEDEQKDGSMRARENVIHEAGLFQGRLGFRKAIVLLESGCGEISNLAGLGQIRFDRGDLPSKFEEVRRVLEREQIIPDKPAG